jgi:hypothetical protein
MILCSISSLFAARQRLMSIYISLAVGCAALGILMTFVLLMACRYFGVDISQNLWLIVLPISMAVALNILLIELYDRFKRK